MIQHGFELGVARKRRPDTMHSELMEGRRLAESRARAPASDICVP